MEDRLILYHRQRRQRQQERKELAAQSCYSLIIVIIALIVLRPLMVSHILSRANAYSAVGQLDESRRQCDKALLIDDNSSDAWAQLARIHKTKGDREAAFDAYTRAVQADCTHRAANFELGMLYTDDNQHQLAIPYFEQVRRLGSGTTVPGRTEPASYYRAALHMLLQCYEKVGDQVKTELTRREIRVFYPDSGYPQPSPTYPQ
ncbi:MAG: hypothetical protein FJ280_08395 [Planctomycetes bacterium]|nr:hypothetical protein [Planctomycetota bacterium]